MKPTAWLAELYRQWHEARGRKLRPASRAFSRNWEDLLDAAGLRSAAERSHALSEAENLEKQGRLTLKRHHYRRHIIEDVIVPIESEPWLISLFSGDSAQELRDRSLTIVRQSQDSLHPRWPESWSRLCDDIIAAFVANKNLKPFFWDRPEALRELLHILYDLTAREWPARTLLRDASTALGLASKLLEQKRSSLESALSILFQEATTFEMLGILGSQSRAIVHGLLQLHFDDGTTQDFRSLRGDFAISLTDLQRATSATTGAAQILSIENAKTTFRQASEANVRGDTLLIATSYPTAATARLLELLPAELPHYHFGDTDVSGYAILRSLRELGPRPVQAFLMSWRTAQDSPPLSEHDRRILPSLITSPLMEDCRNDLHAMAQAGCKGHYEQESRGPASLQGWPFWTQP